MEENQKVIELKGLNNNQLLEQFKNIIKDREVQTISFFISFKPIKQNIRKKIEKNLQDKTYQALTSLNQKKQFDKLFQNIRSSFRPKCTEQVTFVQEITKLYQQKQYEQAIKILKPKETKYFLKGGLSNSPQNYNFNSRNQYNFITFTIGNCYFRLKSYEQAIDYYQKSVQDQPIRQKAQRMNNLGTCYAIKNSYQQALKSYNEAVKIYNQIPQQDMSSLLNNVAMIYLKCDMYKTAQQYFTQSIKERKNKSPNNKEMLFNSYFNLGACQNKSKKYEQSINNLFIALNYACDGFGYKIHVYTMICQVYEEQQKWSEALSYFEKLSEQYEAQQKSQGIIYEQVSKIHSKLGNSTMAAKFAQKALKIYQNQGNSKKISELSSSPLLKLQHIF